jgi:hypothetical protein
VKKNNGTFNRNKIASNVNTDVIQGIINKLNNIINSDEIRNLKEIKGLLDEEVNLTGGYKKSVKKPVKKSVKKPVKKSVKKPVKKSKKPTKK